MKRVRAQKPTIRRGRSWLEILPADPRDPDVVLAVGYVLAGVITPLDFTVSVAWR